MLANYTVQLDSYTGPLELLLNLVEKEKIPILSVPILSLIEQYFDYLKNHFDQSYLFSGDFLVMSSRLMFIKSVYLLPRPEEEALSEAVSMEKEIKTSILKLSEIQQVAETMLAWKESSDKMLPRRYFPWEPKDNYIYQGFYPYRLASFYFTFKKSIDRLEESFPSNAKLVSADKILGALSRIMEGHEKVFLTDVLSVFPNRHELIVGFLVLLELLRMSYCVLVDCENSTDICLEIKEMKWAEKDFSFLFSH